MKRWLHMKIGHIKSFTKDIIQQFMKESSEGNNRTVDHYKATMVLAAVGDAMGYKNGDWEFLTNGKILHEQMMKLTDNKGPLALNITMGWRYSDDTVMHMATAQAMLAGNKNTPLNDICQAIGREYKACWSRMSGRAPGKTTGKSVQVLDSNGSNWNKIPFNSRAYGCGGSMRSACIGLVYFDDTQKLVGLAIESGRITHHNPVGYLGALGASYFTALAIKGIDPKMWIAYFLEEALPVGKDYIKKVGREVSENLDREDWVRFENAVRSYAKKRKLSQVLTEGSEPVFPEKYGVVEREHFYHELAWNGWPGALGIDSLLIAYDAFLSSKGSWEELCLRAILHGGDNDSTGTIAGAWFGAFYGFKGVPKNHTSELEDGKKLAILGEKLFTMTQ